MKTIKVPRIPDDRKLLVMAALIDREQLKNEHILSVGVKLFECLRRFNMCEYKNFEFLMQFVIEEPKDDWVEIKCSLDGKLIHYQDGYIAFQKPDLN